MKYQDSNGPSVDALLRDAFQTYRQGLLRRPLSRATMPDRDFDALVFLGTLGLIPLEVRLKLRDIYTACGRGLIAARKKDLEEASIQYGTAKRLLEPLDDGEHEVGWLLGLSMLEAGVAYLEIQQGRVDRAQNCLDRSMDADLELELLGLSVMHIHRLQQGHNLARVDLRLGKRSDAIRLAGLLLGYMENQLDDLPFHRSWMPRVMREVPRNLVRAMIHQIVGEIASFIVCGASPPEEWSRLVNSSRLPENPEAATFTQVQYALRAQRARLSGDYEGYLLNLIRFFHFGIRECHQLWYPMMIDLVQFCRETDTRLAAQVHDTILRDSSKWKGLSLFLSARLSAFHEG